MCIAKNEENTWIPGQNAHCGLLCHVIVSVILILIYGHAHLKVSFSDIKYVSLASTVSFSLRSTLVGVTATTLWCSFLPRSITWRTFEPFTDWTASLLVFYYLDVLPKKPDLWNIRSVTARCRRNMCVE